MVDLHPRFTVDERGVSVVVLDADEYEQLLILAELNSPDPDAGLTLRPEIVEQIERQRVEYAQGNRGRTVEQVKRRLGLS